MTRSLITLFALALGSTLGSTSACTRAHAAPPSPPGEPDLCELDGGRWCHACESLNSCGEQTDEGWLCCSGGFCVAVATVGDCDTGTVGWCSNYITETTRSGQEIAWCQDG